jgi:GNAT superfamily N-acetyltransferase
MHTVAAAPHLVPVVSPSHKVVAEALIGEYLHWVAGVARAEYGLEFDVEAMVRSDIDDTTKFYPPSGRFYLVEHRTEFVGVGCLKQLAPGVGEIQRMYVRTRARGLGAGRLLVRQLVADAGELGMRTMRLESLRALGVAHELYRSVGFMEIEPYANNSMNEYQDRQAMPAYRKSAVFMELRLPEEAS